ESTLDAFVHSAAAETLALECAAAAIAPAPVITAVKPAAVTQASVVAAKPAAVSPSAIAAPSPARAIESAVPAEVPGTEATEVRIWAPSPDPWRREPGPAVGRIVDVLVGCRVAGGALVGVLRSVGNPDPAVLLGVDPLSGGRSLFGGRLVV